MPLQINKPHLTLIRCDNIYFLFGNDWLSVATDTYMYWQSVATTTCIPWVCIKLAFCYEDDYTHSFTDSVLEVCKVTCPLPNEGFWLEEVL